MRREPAGSVGGLTTAFVEISIVQARRDCRLGRRRDGGRVGSKSRDDEQVVNVETFRSRRRRKEKRSEPHPRKGKSIISLVVVGGAQALTGGGKGTSKPQSTTSRATPGPRERGRFSAQAAQRGGLGGLQGSEHPCFYSVL